MSMISLLGERFTLTTDLTPERAIQAISSAAQPLSIDNMLYTVRVNGNRFYVQEDTRGMLSGLGSLLTSTFKPYWIPWMVDAKPINVSGEVRTELGGTTVEGWISPPLILLRMVSFFVGTAVVGCLWFLILLGLSIIGNNGVDAIALVFLVASAIMMTIGLLLYRTYDDKFKAQFKMTREILQAMVQQRPLRN